MSETSPRRLQGRPFVVGFLVLLALAFGLLLALFWRGPRGRFTGDSMRRELPVPGIVRVFCIDPQQPGPTDLNDRQRCRAADRLEFTVKLVEKDQARAMWVLVGPGVHRLESTKITGEDWTGNIPVKGLQPGPYALTFAFSDREFGDEAVRGALESPPDRAELAPRIEALARFAEAERAKGARFRTLRIPFQLEPDAPH